MGAHLHLHGARENNLKNVDVELPLDSLIIVTGVSGSGKSSLAFDTIYREGQRRFLESFSPRVRQALGKLHRPKVDSLDGIPPTVAIDQLAVVRNPRSTVGTITEIYDALRMLFARAAELDEQSCTPLKSSLFSFNSPEGACSECQGLGVEDRVDPQLLIADSSKTLRQGALVPTTPSGYIVYSQVTVDVLDRVCRAHGFNVDTPWKELSQEQQDVVLNGSTRLVVPFGKHTLESRLRWKGITAKPREEGHYKGLVPTIEEILKRSRNKNALRFVITRPCSSCGGSRLRLEALRPKVGGLNIYEVNGTTIGALLERLEELREKALRPEIVEMVLDQLRPRLEVLCKLGLDHLELRRESTTLSRGEAQRLKLAKLVRGDLSGLLYVLDEPSIGLHAADRWPLYDVLIALRDMGNSLLVVEHDLEAIRAADWLVEIGPGPGESGGHLLFGGATSEFVKASEERDPRLRESATAELLLREQAFLDKPRLVKQRELRITVDGINNLENVSARFLLGGLNVVTGVSGAGKSSLLLEALVPALRGEWASIQENVELSGAPEHLEVIAVDQKPIGRTPRSNPATYTKLFDHIRDLFAAQPEAVARSLGKGHFSLNNEGGRCTACHGAGVRTLGMHFLGDVTVPCEACQGRRFSEEVLAVRFRGKSVLDVLRMSVSRARQFFTEHRRIQAKLEALEVLGLGYLELGQPSTTLSGGEAQRIKLATELSKSKRGETLYVLDEPTTGLHGADVRRFMNALEGFVSRGHTVIIIEHEREVIRAADWVIDLGPEAGERGGRVMAMGPPEEIARCQASRTGQLLRGELDRTQERREKRVNAAKKQIALRGVRTNNLKSIDVDIPLERMIAITGVSGSGKSSLAVDTIAELGFRRFVESLPSYARRFISTRHHAELDDISGLRPAIRVPPGKIRRSPRSTLGTMTGALDPIRLAFARFGLRTCLRCSGPVGPTGRCESCGEVTRPGLWASSFSFNHERGACERCRGLGTITTCDPQKLVTHRQRSVFDGALSGTKTGRFYGDPKGKYLAILKKVDAQLHLELGRRPWSELSQEVRNIVMFGTGEQEWDVTWSYQRGKRCGEHRWRTHWRGFVAEVDEEYARKHADKRGEAMRELMRDVVCPLCHGQRLGVEPASVELEGVAITTLLDEPLERTNSFFSRLCSTQFGSNRCEGLDFIAREVIAKLESPLRVGLGNLPLSRRASDLSGGEAERARIASQLNSGVANALYVFDEPTRGLHPLDVLGLIDSLKRLRGRGNTVIVVEHDLSLIEAADHVVELGPGGGQEGGEVLFSGSPQALAAFPDSPTAPFLRRDEGRGRAGERRALRPGIAIRDASLKNLDHLDVDLPIDGLIAICGVSGSGKSSLLLDVVAQSIQRSEPIGCAELHVSAEIERTLTVDQVNPVGAATSTPASLTGVFDDIRAEFSKTPTARERGFTKARFTYLGKSGRCETCKGLGRERIEMGFLPELWSACASCNGQRFNDSTLEVEHRGRNIAQVLAMTFSEAAEHFESQAVLARKLSRLCEIGLGAVTLGQPTSTLSGGEMQRVKLGIELLAKEGATRRGGPRKPSFYFLDEPTTGLHASEVTRLITLLDALVDAGNTVFVIEHELRVLWSADHLIELGPGGGDEGGKILFSGSPERLAEASATPTGRALASWMRAFPKV